MQNQPVVIVTGASRGMGAWIAKWLSKAGAKVMLTARSSKELQALEKKIRADGGSATHLSGNVSDPKACFDVVEKTIKQFGRIDALVNNAGIVEPVSKVSECDPEQFRKNILVNLVGPFYMIHEALVALKESKGRVINVSSGAAIRPVASWSAYCSAKAGLTHLTRVLAAEEPSITAISIRPGVVDTNMQALIREKGPEAMPSELSKYFINLKQHGKLEPPWIPARSIAWLALKAPRKLSGEFINYDDPKIFKPALDFFGDAHKIEQDV
jgi:NAD(P)-dependent dehydrogenase (short-subunit alcohol dehydrogenase family)